MKKRTVAALFLSGMIIGGIAAGPTVSALGEAVTAYRSTQAVYVNGKQINLEMYLINGNNYVKLRDVGRAADFNVFWDGAVQIDRNSHYTGEGLLTLGGSSGGASEISQEAAVNIALTQAGVQQSQVTGLRVERGAEDGVAVYEIEFYVGSTEYDFDINVYTGAIVDRSEEYKGTSGGTANDIGQEAAVSIALNHAGVQQSQITGLRVERGTEKGVQVYEIEFFVGSTEYDFDVDCASGRIVDRSVENRGGGTGDIGQEAAIDAALKHAGLSRSEVTGLYAKLDNDDGQQVYEVKFYAGIYEYEYKIAPATGQILSWDKDIND